MIQQLVFLHGFAALDEATTPGTDVKQLITTGEIAVPVIVGLYLAIAFLKLNQKK